MPLTRALSLIRSAEEHPENLERWGVDAVRSPWAPQGNLSRVVLEDIFGETALGPVTRAECMAIPAIARARHKLVVAVAKGVLRELEGATPVEEQPIWLSRTDGRTSPQHRIVWTVDDLIFGGWSLWAVERAAKGDVFSPILDAGRAPAHMWQIADDGTVEMRSGDDWVPIDDESSIVLIPGFHEGLIGYATRTVRGAANLEETAAAQAANPIPAVELHQETDDEMTPEERKDLVSRWQEALQSRGGSVAFTPRSIKVIPHGKTATDLLVQGRNAAAIDAARMVGLPASTIDASNVNSTLTYETTEGRNLEFLEDAVALYADPIAARLSMDDVCAPGRRIDWDFGAYTAKAPTTTLRED